MVKAFYRETWVEVDADAIFNNVHQVRRLLPSYKTLIAVVKANAYGHGDKEVAEVAIEAGADMLAVAFLDEAISLRQKGITKPILVLGAVPPSYVEEAVKWDITVTAYSEEWVAEVISNGLVNKTLRVHLKIDTGMGRLGVRTEDEIMKVVKMIHSHSEIELEGVFTHFATADELDSLYFTAQYERFEKLVAFLKTLNVNPPFIHCANSAAVFQKPMDLFTCARLGISMYGLSPSRELKPTLPISLQEAFSLHSKLVHVKKVAAGSSISYGATYKADKDEWIGTVPIGYADGWIRKLHNFHVLIDGMKMPIIGRICMDQLMVRLPAQYPVGTQVTLIGKQGDQEILIDQIAEHLETINYEIPCMISARVPRVLKKGNKQMHINNYILQQQ
ncbi:alanine racemase [Priestia megaterium]|nr:alanine racemase [Priestia megaterium]